MAAVLDVDVGSKGGPFAENVVANLVASAVIVVAQAAVTIALADPGRSVVRAWLQLLAAAGPTVAALDAGISVRAVRRWRRARRPRPRKVTRLWRGSFNRYIDLLKFHLSLSIASTVIVWLLLAHGMLVSGLMASCGTLVIFVCARHKRDRLKRMLGLPPAIARHRPERTAIPPWVTRLVLNPAGQVGAPRAAVFGATLTAASTLFAFGIFDGPAEVARAAEAVGEIYQAAGELVTNADDEGVAATSPTAVPSADDAAGHRAVARYVVRSGDSFWSIAARTLSTELEREATDAEVLAFCGTLVALNREVLVEQSNPNLLLPGQVLNVPDAHSNSPSVLPC